MARYFFHLWTGERFEFDQIGLDLPGAEHAYLEAFRGAQDIWSESLRQRRDATCNRLDVTDEHGTVVFALPFTEVLGRRPVARPDDAANVLGRCRAATYELTELIRSVRKTMTTSQRLIDRVGKD